MRQQIHPKLQLTFVNELHDVISQKILISHLMFYIFIRSGEGGSSLPRNRLPILNKILYEFTSSFQTNVRTISLPKNTLYLTSEILVTTALDKLHISYDILQHLKFIYVYGSRMLVQAVMRLACIRDVSLWCILRQRQYFSLYGIEW
jgi:hypothetical protein